MRSSPKIRLAGLILSLAFVSSAPLRPWGASAAADVTDESRMASAFSALGAAPLFEFLKERARPADSAARKIEFVTASPGVSSRSRWVEILAQIRPLEYSKVALERNEAGPAFKGMTENVLGLALDAAAPADGAKVTIELDGSKVEASPAPGASRIFLERGEKGWL